MYPPALKQVLAIFPFILVLDVGAFTRGIQWQHLLAEPLLALLGRNIALLDIAHPSGRRAFVQVLHELAQRVLVTLCFPGDLVTLSVATVCSER